MPRKTKASAEEKAQIVEAYLRGEMGLKSAAAKLSVVISTIRFPSSFLSMRSPPIVSYKCSFCMLIAYISVDVKNSC